MRHMLQVDLECALLDGRSSYNRPSSCAMTDISSLYSFRPATSDAPQRFANTNHVATRAPPTGRMSPRVAATRAEFNDPDTAGRPISAPSLSGSALAKQRIETLEAELARARQERMAMQDHVSNLAHELSSS